jgi:deoxyribodipyrimidine photo-lyase
MSTIFIFRRDYRLHDNNGLRFAISLGKPVYPIFIFTPEQIDKNRYRSQNAINFMTSALHHLRDELKQHGSTLHTIHDDNISALEKLCAKISATDIVFNIDYTPYARHRDNQIKKWCSKKNIACHLVEDYLLAPIGTFNKADGSPYQIFTPFASNVFDNKEKIAHPKKYRITNLAHISGYNFFPPHEKIKNATRQHATFLMNRSFAKYEELRNYPAVDGTSGLSPYIKFGLVSIREVFWRWSKYHTIATQIVWREFYFYLTYFRPDVLEKHKDFRPYKKKWKHNATNFRRWTEGETGCPIVDAGMRELNETGHMHNRLRLITANYLCRTLGEDWRLGERYFATMLTDYDPCVNNGNWQWIAGTGVNTKPQKQQVFNMFNQSKKYDPDCVYIKKWLPILRNVAPREIHRLANNSPHSSHEHYANGIVQR